ncbi:MAG: ubiquitin-like domain-containing protein [Propionibacteriaceae bacterium]|nr:ubiquitin-like domain-containing protein [Propionibacteriaceae bacterium]
MSVIKTIALSVVGVLALTFSGFGLKPLLGHDVTLIIDGQPRTVSVIYGSVSEVLADEGVTVSARDRVTPSMEAVAGNQAVIEVEYARLIDLTLNGQRGAYWTYSTTVSAVLEDLGLGESSIQVSAPQTDSVPREGMALTVDTGYDVDVTADGQTRTIHSFGTVANALTDLGLAWDENDVITPLVADQLTDKLPISLVRVDEQTVNRDVAIAFETQNSDDPDSTQGKVTVVTEGVEGVRTQTVLQVLHDGQVVSETVTAEVVTREPVTKVTTTGTKAPAASAPAVSVTPGSAQAIAHDLVLARGWDESEFNCLVALWNKESGWRTTAANPSGAYGIPQALPGSKMAAFGSDWQTNPETQIKWGLSYIEGRYSTPCGGWAAFQSKGWY